MYQKYQHNDQAQLIQDHAAYFYGKRSTALLEDEFNKNQHFVIVTNGADQETIESIIYWKKNGLNIDAIVCWVFEVSSEYFIEFNMHSQINDFLECENNCYVLNTDYKNDSAHHEAMLKEHKAAAYNHG